MPELKKANKPAAKNGNGGKAHASNGKPAAAKPKEKDRPVVYPELAVNDCVIPAEKLKLTTATMKALLGWETEEDYGIRLVAENPNAKKITAVFGEDYLLKNTKGEKVRCWNNCRNRPFDEQHARRLAQDILAGNWRMNGETIIVGKTGSVESGQHRGVALILAAEMWAANKDHYACWKEEPFIQSLLVQGAEEDAVTIRTLDNVKPRSDADTIYTSGVFDALNTVGKKECSRMLASATDLLWRRTGAGTLRGSTVYRTHSTSAGFRERHPKLLKCVKHIYEENSDRAFSVMKLSPGECAGLMYLMAATDSDIDKYRTADEPGEKQLDMGHWDKAEEFWVEMAAGKKEGAVVRQALAKLIAPGETNARRVEKHCVLAAAWNQWLTGKGIVLSHLELDVQENAKGRLVVTNAQTFGGIDLGDSGESEDDDGEHVPTKEEVEAEKAKKRQELAEQEARIIAARKKEAEDAKTRVPAPTKPAPQKAIPRKP